VLGLAYLPKISNCPEKKIYTIGLHFRGSLKQLKISESLIQREVVKVDLIKRTFPSAVSLIFFKFLKNFANCILIVTIFFKLPIFFHEIMICFCFSGSNVKKLFYVLNLRDSL
jgi:hypothetical protein